MKGKQMSKALKVVSVHEHGEQEVTHPIGEAIPEDSYIAAILKGVTNAGSMIKSFEVVEV